jgi:hypothetical protein
MRSSMKWHPYESAVAGGEAFRPPLGWSMKTDCTASLAERLGFLIADAKVHGWIK